MRIERAIVVAYQYIEELEELEELDTAECSLHKDEGAEHRCMTAYNLLQATQPYEIWINSRLELVTRTEP